ncbi:MAG: glycosyltransferase family 2 protein [Thermoleophilaceae bacterium]|nr:glycosyltransferase family 2 protein [Thermoleophilaceae bacterium]
MAVKVSVVVPVYNPGAYIDDCIASILRQSLPSDEYEAIFVDDGSTDGTADRLDAVAAQHDNITAIHIPNSGWPGRPRNVGIEAAAGKYVYFVDNDDWISDEALERLYDYAERNGADVVVGKIVGHGKGKYVPRYQFARNVDDASLTDGGNNPPLLGLLSPHKLFRRSFLDEHEIRFPEGRRRLEDHVFVMEAFLQAKRMSILSDYPCYHWMSREDATNASFAPADPVVYYRAVRDVLDVIDKHTAPGLQRDRLYLHWYRSNVLQRMRGKAWVEGRDPHVRETFSEVHRLASERFGPGVTGLLPGRFKPLSRSLMAGRLDLVAAQAAIENGLKADVVLDSIEATPAALRLSVSATMSYADGTPVRLIERGGTISWQPPPPLAGEPTILADDLDFTSEVAATKLSLVLRHRGSLVEYEVPLRLQEQTRVIDDALIIAPRGTVVIDPATVAIGSELEAGTWDTFIELRSCGWVSIRRLSRVGGRPIIGRRMVEPYTTDVGNLSLRVTDFAHPKPRNVQPVPPAPHNRGPSRRRVHITNLMKRALPGWALRWLRRFRSR